MHLTGTPNPIMKNLTTVILTAAVLIGITLGCAESRGPLPSSRQSSDAHGHYHEAPHGGTRVALGEKHHMELVLNASSGAMQSYLLDGHMHEYVLIPPQTFEILGTNSSGRETLVFHPVTTNQAGKASERTALFEAKSDWLTTNQNFGGLLRQITIQGKEYKNISFRFPEGNE